MGHGIIIRDDVKPEAAVDSAIKLARTSDFKVKREIIRLARSCYKERYQRRHSSI
jgi:hypothetical protein